MDWSPVKFPPKSIMDLARKMDFALSKWKRWWVFIEKLTLEQILHGLIAFNSEGKNISDKVNTISCVELCPQMEGSRIRNSGVVGNDAER